MDDKQRFVDRRGWLRNRRAVVLDDEGITVERWVGRPLSIPWGDVRAVWWEGAEVLAVDAIGRRMRLGAGVLGLQELAQAVDAAMEARDDGAGGLAVAGEDIERWLDGFVAGRVEITGCKSMYSVLGGVIPLLPMCVSGAAGTMALLAAATWEPYCGYLAFFILVVGAIAGLTLGLLACTNAIVRAVTRRAIGVCEVRADRGRVSVNDQGTERSFSWHEVLSVDPVERGFVVDLRGGSRVALPGGRVFRPVIQALRHVVAARSVPTQLDRPVPETALSIIDQPASSDAIDRGLSHAVGDSE